MSTAAPRDSRATPAVAPPQSTVQRHASIRQQIGLHRRVEVAALAEEFGVAEETVRRDLRQLEGEGVLVRVHGGAVLASEVLESLTVPLPEQQRTTTDQIVAAALEELPPAGAVFLGPGDVSVALAGAAPDCTELSIVTTSVQVSLLAAAKEESAVYCVGGAADGDELTGPSAREILEELEVEVAFIEAQGLSARGAVTVATPQQAANRRLILSRARRRVLLLTGGEVASAARGDSGHRPTTGLVTAAGLEDFDLVLTREELNAELSDRARENDCEVVVL